MQCELGTVLMVLRVFRGWTQEELAKASGLRLETIVQYEDGIMIPGLNSVSRMMNAMDYPFRALDNAREVIKLILTLRTCTSLGAKH